MTMVLEEIIKVWSLEFYSLLHFTNFTSYLPKKISFNESSNDNRIFDGTSSFVLFTIWLILYYAYKKFLNLTLRRMKYLAVKRNRLIDGLWCCGFSICSMIFITFLVPDKQDCPWRPRSDYPLGFLIHKTFYLHRAAIELFLQNHWLKGWTSQLFASSVPAPSSEKWSEASKVLLFYKASDVALLNICRLLLTLSRHKLLKKVTKFIFMLRFVNWVYLYILLVTRSLLFDTGTNCNLRMQASLWLWIICEFLYSVRYKEFACLYSKQSLETSLFPPPSQELVEFVNILKKHRNCIKNNKIETDENAQKKKDELWQTIVCAMTMKKKLKALRERKEKALEKNNFYTNKAVN